MPPTNGSPPQETTKSSNFPRFRLLIFSMTVSAIIAPFFITDNVFDIRVFFVTFTALIYASIDVFIYLQKDSPSNTRVKKSRRPITVRHKFKIYNSPKPKPKKPNKVKIITTASVLLISLILTLFWNLITGFIQFILDFAEKYNPISISVSLALLTAFILFILPRIFIKLQQVIVKLTNKYFISSLTGFALVGALSALLIPSYTDWFRNPESSTTQQATTAENKNKPQESSPPTNSSNNNKAAEVEQKTTSDLRLHILYLTGGIIAILSLIETNRKNTLEHSRQTHAARRDRYIESVDKLSSGDAPVRLGGVYTLIALIDEWLTDETLTKNIRERECQVIINNLCAYIRSPFPLAENAETFTKN